MSGTAPDGAMGPATLVRAAAGGLLAGLANLVPGISGGTMLLAVGVYPQCITAIARVSTLRPDRPSVTLLAVVALSAGAVILAAAGWVRDQVVTYRWAAYSIFIGATLGGIPLLWRKIGRPSGPTWAGASIGLAATLAVALAPVPRSVEAAGSAFALFAVGLAAFAATLLPGLSGGYLLVVSGQYVRVLGAVDSVKAAILPGDGIGWAQLGEAAVVLVPFAVGMLAALVGLSALIRYLLDRHTVPMLGFLLGLLAGAVPGIWPFWSEGRGLHMPDAAQGAGALALACCGFLTTVAISRLDALGNRRA